MRAYMKDRRQCAMFGKFVQIADATSAVTASVAKGEGQAGEFDGSRHATAFWVVRSVSCNKGYVQADGGVRIQAGTFAQSALVVRFADGRSGGLTAVRRPTKDEGLRGRRWGQRCACWSATMFCSVEGCPIVAR